MPLKPTLSKLLTEAGQKHCQSKTSPLKNITGQTCDGDGDGGGGGDGDGGGDGGGDGFFKIFLIFNLKMRENWLRAFWEEKLCL